MVSPMELKAGTELVADSVGAWQAWLAPSAETKLFQRYRKLPKMRNALRGREAGRKRIHETVRRTGFHGRTHVVSGNRARQLLRRE